MADNAYLTNTNIPLGSEFNDGTRLGPILDRTVVSGAGVNGQGFPYSNTTVQPYSYTQWGLGMFTSAKNTYNIIPRGPSIAGNIVGFGAPFAPGGAANLALSQDGYVSTSGIAGNGSTYLQLDWPRALSVTIANGNIGAIATITVFGQDYYGVSLQESVVVNDAGTYDLKKAFYTVTRVYWNGAATGSTVQIQATDTFGLPFRLKSAGDIDSIRWGNASDMSTSEEDVSSNNLTGVATLASNPGSVIVNSPAVTKASNIQVTVNTAIGTARGHLSVPVADVINNTSFVINSDADDQSTINWLITNPPFVTGSSATYGAGASNMINGAITIPSTNVNANSFIYSNVSTFGTAHGSWSILNINPEVSFTITSTDNTETSSAEWAIMPQEWVSGISTNMVAGVINVNTTSVQSNSIILVNYQTISGTAGTLSVRSNEIIPGVGFTIRSSSNIDTSTVKWTILQNIQGLTQGTATLAAGTATIATTSVAANSVILACYNTLGGAANGTWIDVTTKNNGVSFIVQAKDNAGNLVNTDVSTFNWVIFPYNMVIADYAAPLGDFIPADDNTATNTTGDVRGTYKPSTPANGYNVLHFTAFISGFDNFVSQQASVPLPAGGQVGALRTRRQITIDDQVGVMQYYSGTPA